MKSDICKNCYWLSERKSGYWHNGHEDTFLVCDKRDNNYKVEATNSCEHFKSNNIFEWNNRR